MVSLVEGEIVKKWQASAVPKKLAEQLISYFGGANIKSAYEAGFSGFVLHRELEKVGIENLVVNPSSVEVAVHNRVKTDKRDALKLAGLREARRLKGVRVPSEKQESQRLLTRTRQELVEERTAIKNKIRMKCHQMGLIEADDPRKMSHKFVKELLLISAVPELNLIIEAKEQVWQTLEIQMKKLEKELERQE